MLVGNRLSTGFAGSEGWSGGVVGRLGKGKDGAGLSLSALLEALKPQSRCFSQDSGGQKASRGNHLTGGVLN